MKIRALICCGVLLVGGCVTRWARVVRLHNQPHPPRHGEVATGYGFSTTVDEGDRVRGAVVRWRPPRWMWAGEVENAN